MVIKYPCLFCTKSVRSNQNAILCTFCHKWSHLVCGNVTPNVFESESDWICSLCIFEQMPFKNDLTFYDNSSNLEKDLSEKEKTKITCNHNDSTTRGCDFPKEKGITVAHLNIRSLKNKISDLQSFLSENSYDLLSLSETWTNEDITDNMLFIKGYTLERKDREDFGGGVGCYVNEKLTYIRRCDLECRDLELMWLELKRTNASPIFVGIAYRKPSSNNSYFEALENEIEKVYSISNNVRLTFLLLDLQSSVTLKHFYSN